jgi:hypothetical protein
MVTKLTEKKLDNQDLTQMTRGEYLDKSVSNAHRRQAE